MIAMRCIFPFSFFFNYQSGVQLTAKICSTIMPEHKYLASKPFQFYLYWCFSKYDTVLGWNPLSNCLK